MKFANGSPVKVKAGFPFEGRKGYVQSTVDGLVMVIAEPCGKIVAVFPECLETIKLH